MNESYSAPPAEVRFPHVLFGSLSTVIAVLAFFLTGFAAQRLTGMATDDPAIIVLQAGAQVMGLLLPAVLLSRRSPLGVRGLLRLDVAAGSSLAYALLPLVLALTFLCESAVNQLQLSLLPAGLVTWMNDMSSVHDAAMKALLHAEGPWSVPLQLVCLAVIPAIAEEVVFRGVLQRSLEASLRPSRAILITTLVFCLLHFQPSTLLPMLVLGTVLGMLAYRSRSLVPGMILHAVFNGIMVVLFQMGVAEMGDITPSMPVWQSGMLALAGGWGLVWTLKRLRN
ncbi:MAG: lysostaphin resistance A-like protein [Candidatus Kapaibacterium sp.]